MSVSSSAKKSAKRGNITESIFEAAPGSAPPGGLDMMAMMALMQQGQQNTLANLRSPMVRRTMSGGVVNEAAPTGLDSLREIPHSWEEPRRTSYVPSGNNEPTVAPQTLFTGANGRAVVTPYGGGYSPFAGHNMGTVDAPTYGPGSMMEDENGNPHALPAMLAAEDKRVTRAGLPQHQANITAAYNDTLLSPFRVDNPVLPMTPTDPTDPDRTGGRKSIFDSPPPNARDIPTPAAPPSEYVPPVDSHYAIPPVAAHTTDTLRTSDGLIPQGFRKAVGALAGVADMGIDALWDSSHNTAISDGVRPFITPDVPPAAPAVPQASPPTDPRLTSSHARALRDAERSRLQQESIFYATPQGSGQPAPAAVPPPPPVQPAPPPATAQITPATMELIRRMMGVQQPAINPWGYGPSF